MYTKEELNGMVSEYRAAKKTTKQANAESYIETKMMPVLEKRAKKGYHAASFFRLTFKNSMYYAIYAALRKYGIQMSRKGMFIDVTW